MKPRTRQPLPARSIAVVAAYAVLSVAGLLGTWYFNLTYSGTDGTYVEAWFANPASSSAAVDVIVTALVACIFYGVEGRRLGWRLRWLLFIPLTFVIALAFALPLFLMLRELQLAQGAPHERTTGQSPMGQAA
ncbi:DUF2834 domain-containing protein [Arthrobacter agilis]|uniref:DUF2834 domain-containing protein n=1 Tax=Arthrobacter agilis TaxID=37921 RepID=UPI0027837FB3|nr:DUF2834 domain-containing protein [Arthrobacter agilis]MDQ0736564.1 ABC-type multidrug transport system permease subunit [Arthrobacter agilis]